VKIMEPFAQTKVFWCWDVIFNSHSSESV